MILSQRWSVNISVKYEWNVTENVPSTNQPQYISILPSCSTASLGMKLNKIVVTWLWGRCDISVGTRSWLGIYGSKWCYAESIKVPRHQPYQQKLIQPYDEKDNSIPISNFRNGNHWILCVKRSSLYDVFGGWIHDCHSPGGSSAFYCCKTIANT